MPNHMITLIIALSMVYCTDAGNFFGRGPYDRVMLDPGYPGATQGHAGWTVEKVSL